MPYWLCIIWKIQPTVVCTQPLLWALSKKNYAHHALTIGCKLGTFALSCLPFISFNSPKCTLLPKMLLPALIYLRAQAQWDFAKHSQKDVWQCLSSSSCIRNRLPKGTSVKAEPSAQTHLTHWKASKIGELHWYKTFSPLLPLTHCTTAREAMVLKSFSFGNVDLTNITILFTCFYNRVEGNKFLMLYLY